MAGRIDIAQQEKDLAIKITGILRPAIRSKIKETSKTVTGDSLKIANSGFKFKTGRLQRITMKAPYYIFMQNYGFEGKKSNGVAMRLKATDLFSKVLDETKVLETLADEISEIRLNEVVSIIQFKKNNGR